MKWKSHAWEALVRALMVSGIPMTNTCVSFQLTPEAEAGPRRINKPRREAQIGKIDTPVQTTASPPSLFTFI